MVDKAVFVEPRRIGNPDCRSLTDQGIRAEIHQSIGARQSGAFKNEARFRLGAACSRSSVETFGCDAIFFPGCSRVFPFCFGLGAAGGETDPCYAGV